MSSIPERLCAFCGEHLPQKAHHSRKYHETCFDQARGIAKREWHAKHPEKQRAYNQRYRQKEHPMRMLCMDCGNPFPEPMSMKRRYCDACIERHRQESNQKVERNRKRKRHLRAYHTNYARAYRKRTRVQKRRSPRKRFPVLFCAKCGKQIPEKAVRKAGIHRQPRFCSQSCANQSHVKVVPPGKEPPSPEEQKERKRAVRAAQWQRYYARHKEQVKARNLQNYHEKPS